MCGAGGLEYADRQDRVHGGNRKPSIARPFYDALRQPQFRFAKPRFGAGLAVFFTGMWINIQSDGILRNLRKPGETNYKIPKGGLFRYVSGANFLGEIAEWSGFAIAAGSFEAVAFAVFTFCNLAPRAYHHHLWYKETFKGAYPRSRKALIPFVF